MSCRAPCRFFIHSDFLCPLGPRSQVYIAPYARHGNSGSSMMEDVRLLTLQLLITVHCTRMCHFGPQNKSSKEAVWRVVKVATHKTDSCCFFDCNQVQRAGHGKGPHGVDGETEGAGSWNHPTLIHCLRVHACIISSLGCSILTLNSYF